MTKREGQGKGEIPAVKPGDLPSENEHLEAEAGTPPRLINDPILTRDDSAPAGENAAVPDVLHDTSVQTLASDHETSEADLPLVQEDRASLLIDPDTFIRASQEGLSIIEDEAVITAAQGLAAAEGSASAPVVVEDHRGAVGPWDIGSPSADLGVFHDPRLGASLENTAEPEEAVVGVVEHPQHSVTLAEVAVPAADLISDVEIPEEAAQKPLRPLPMPIDLAALHADRPKSVLRRLFGRKSMAADEKPADPVRSSEKGTGNVTPAPGAIEEDTASAEVAEVSTDLSAAAANPAGIAVQNVIPADPAPIGKRSFFRGKSKRDETEAPKSARLAKARKTPKRSRGNPPIQVIIGWIGESNRKDVIEHARGFAADHIETLDSAWIAVNAFRDGHIFEVHEGGSGLAYMPDIIEQLTRDPDQVVWVPSGTVLNRVLTIRIAEDQIFSTVLTEAESTLVRGSGQEPLARTGRMVRLVPKGTGALATGIALAAVGAFTLIGAGYYASLINQQPLPSRTFNPENLPHSQIIRLSEGIRDDRWVSRIVFEDGQWRADFETVEELVLPVDDAGAQAVIDDLYKEEDRIKKAVEDSIEKETAQ